MIELGLLSITSFVNLILGLVVFLKNPKSATNKLFLFLACSFAVWSILNYMSVHPVILSQIVWVRLVLLCAALLCLMVYLTFTVFPSHKMIWHKEVYWAITATIIVMLLTQTPYVFKLNEQQEPAPNFAMPLFAALTISLIGAGIFNIVKKFIQAFGKQKNQLRLVLFGIAGSLGLIFITNFLLVIVFNNTNFIPLGPTFTLVFSGFLAYAIVKHGLFDIRAAIARSVAYLLSLASIGLLYGVVVFSVSLLLSTSEQQFNLLQRSFYIGFALITAIVFPYTKRFFDKLTNSLFYRDAYDPEQLLGKLNRALVTHVDVESLLRNIARLIENNIKVEYCAFVIHKTSYVDERVIGTKSRRLSMEDKNFLRHVLPKVHERVIVADSLEHDERELKNLMERYEIGLLARLVTTTQHDVDGIGYLMLGAKKSGNPYTSQDENTLQIIANELIIAIQNALRFEEIENFNITLQRKVDDATRELRKTNEKLKRVDETKDEFISMASHQLRTPLTSVKGYLSMVLEGDAGKVSEMQRKLLDQAFISSQRMVYLIADLLNVSRLRTGKFILESVTTNLAEVVEGEASQLQNTAASRGLTLTYEKPATFPELVLDETKIRQVIMNFMDNAIYYTPSGGQITVKLKETDKTIEYTVTDDGIGVPKKEQHQLFAKFYRADNAKKARPDGTGLGLFMAKKVIVAQGGSLIFRSAEGKGSTFGFSFEKSRIMPKQISV